MASRRHNLGSLRFTRETCLRETTDKQLSPGVFNVRGHRTKHFPFASGESGIVLLVIGVSGRGYAVMLSAGA